MINGYIAYLKRSKCGENELGAQYTVHKGPGEYFMEDDEDPEPSQTP